MTEDVVLIARVAINNEAFKVIKKYFLSNQLKPH